MCPEKLKESERSAVSWVAWDEETSGPFSLQSWFRLHWSSLYLKVNTDETEMKKIQGELSLTEDR